MIFRPKPTVHAHTCPAEPSRETAWHTLDTASVADKLGVSAATGLSVEEAALRLARHGPNTLQEKPPRAGWLMFLDQFNDFMILILLAAAIVSGVVGDMKDMAAILVIVILNAVIGLVQERQAQRALASLKEMSATQALVVRNNEPQQIPAEQLVPGDVVMLAAGDLLPADLHLSDTCQLTVDESVLTGEANTVEKSTNTLTAEDLALGDRLNLAFKGTMVTHGRGRGITLATGMNTELGRIAGLLDNAEQPRTPLQKRLAAFGKRLGLAVLAICAIIFVVGLLRGETPLMMFLTAISLAVAGIPEALPTLITVALALGARKMVAQHALIRRLPAMETLGSVSFICTDKTGTLTQNKMQVHEVYAAGQSVQDWSALATVEPWASLFTAMALSNDTHVGQHGKLSGDPTETALYLAAQRAGHDKMSLEKHNPRLFELPFDSQRKCMTTVHQQSVGVVAYTKGAPENVLAACDNVCSINGPISIDKGAILAIADQMATRGFRVLAVAKRDWQQIPVSPDAQTLEAGLSFIGLIGMMDPPRPEAKSAVNLCKSAGITPVMITGDHAATAYAIACQLGIATATDQLMTGPELARLSDEALRQQVRHIRVYARVDPAQKIRIVEALQAEGEFVAMTGDGVNDAPALKRADIGIAMGKSGTDVAREAASLVLLDDNFATIVHAVREGRRIFDNIRKFIRYAMTGNSAEIWVIFLAPFLGLPTPLLPIHILWINLLTDGLPGLALAAEPAERGIMQRPPRPPNESLFAQGMWQHIIFVGLSIAGVSLFAQAWAIHSGSQHWQTMVFTVLTLAQMCHVMAIRSERSSLFRHGGRSNRPLLGAVLLTFALQMATIYVPWLNPIFNTAPLTLVELAICLALSLTILAIVETEKWLIRRGKLYQQKI